MNEKAIRQLRTKFILLSMLGLSLTMLVIGSLIFLTNMSLTHRQINKALDYLIEHDGDFPEESDMSELAPEPGHRYNFIRFFGEFANQYSQIQSLLYGSTRCFALLYDEEGNVTELKTHNMPDFGAEEASSFAALALAHPGRTRSSGNYYYRAGKTSEGLSIVVFLDAAAQIDNLFRLMYSALSLITLGILITLIFVRILSERAIRPEIENAELQKRFITNASHELKTPLAVIKANAEMQELLSGENEWTQSTLRQVDRLNGLVQNLVMITRAQEKEEASREDLDATKILSETTETFRPVAESEGKHLESSIPEGLSFHATDSELRQLASLLLDNAIKYCDENGTISVTASRKGKVLTFSVSNHYADGKNVDYNRFFERFYREDSSHNVDQGGYGIGLSIARSLVERYDGSIRAEWKEGIIRFVCMLKE